MGFDPISFLLGSKAGGGGGGGGIDPSDATATAGDILASKTAYIADGSKATGTIQSKSAATYYPSASDQTIASGQYLSGAQTIKAVTYDGLSAGNIKKDVVVKIGDASDDDRIVSITGTYEGGGGGSSPWTKLAEQDFTVSTTSTSATDVGTISISGIYSAISEKRKYFYVFVRDNAGKRNGYYYGNDYLRLGDCTSCQSVYVKADGTTGYLSAQYGVYPRAFNANSITIASKYSANLGTLDGTFHVEVWSLDYPAGITSPFI